MLTIGGEEVEAARELKDFMASRREVVSSLSSGVEVVPEGLMWGER